MEEMIPFLEDCVNFRNDVSTHEAAQKEHFASRMSHVGWICKPYGPIRMDHNIVNGVEPSSVVVRQYWSSFVGRFGFHINETSRVIHRPLVTKEHAISVTGWQEN